MLGILIYSLLVTEMMALSLFENHPNISVVVIVSNITAGKGDRCELHLHRNSDDMNGPLIALLSGRARKHAETTEPPKVIPAAEPAEPTECPESGEAPEEAEAHEDPEVTQPPRRPLLERLENARRAIPSFIHRVVGPS